MSYSWQKLKLEIKRNVYRKYGKWAARPRLDDPRPASPDTCWRYTYAVAVVQYYINSCDLSIFFLNCSCKLRPLIIRAAVVEYTLGSILVDLTTSGTDASFSCGCRWRHFWLSAWRKASLELLTCWFCFGDLEVYCCFAVLVGIGLHLECRYFHFDGGGGVGRIGVK